MVYLLLWNVDSCSQMHILRPTSLVNILGPSSSRMTATPLKSISQELITLTSTVVHPFMWSAEALSFPQPPQGIRPRWNSCEDPAISCNWHCPSSYSNLYPITVQTSEMPTQWKKAWIAPIFKSVGGSDPQIQPTTARFPWPRLHVRCWSTYSAFTFSVTWTIMRSWALKTMGSGRSTWQGPNFCPLPMTWWRAVMWGINWMSLY